MWIINLIPLHILIDLVAISRNPRLAASLTVLISELTGTQGNPAMTFAREQGRFVKPLLPDAARLLAEVGQAATSRMAIGKDLPGSLNDPFRRFLIPGVFNVAHAGSPIGSQVK